MDLLILFLLFFISGILMKMLLWPNFSFYYWIKYKSFYLDWYDNNYFDLQMNKERDFIDKLNKCYESSLKLNVVKFKYNFNEINNSLIVDILYNNEKGDEYIFDRNISVDGNLSNFFQVIYNRIIVK
jgi:hypothetical protein